MKILFVMRTTVYVRNFESTLRTLAARGHQVHVVAPIHYLFDPTRLIERLAVECPGITHGLPPGGPIDKWAALSEELRRGVDYLRYLGREYHDAPKLVHRAERYAPTFVLAAAKRPIARSPVGRAALSRTLRAVERALPIDPCIIEFVRNQNPDLVIVTPLVEPGSPQAQYLRAARALGIRTALCVYSWDNLTNKGLIQDPLDLVTVWNQAMRREAIELHGVPPERVVVTGAQPYDQWFEWKPRLRREEFCERVGLPADRPYLLYLCSSKFIAPQEASFVRRWIDDVRNASAILANTGVLIRPHPQYTGPWKGAGLANIEAVAVWPRDGANPVDVESRSDFYDSIFHSAAVVGVNTSAQIESAIIGRGVYTILAPEFRDTQEGTLHFRHLRTVNGGMLHVAGSLDEHVTQLEEAVRSAGRDDGRCRRFIEAFVRPHGIDNPATPRLVAAIEGMEATRARAPERPPWFAGFLRSRLESFADACLRESEQRQQKELEPRGGKTDKKRPDRSAPLAASGVDASPLIERKQGKAPRGSDDRFSQRVVATYEDVRNMVRQMKAAAGVTSSLPQLQPLWNATPEMLMRLRQFGACVGGARPSDYVDTPERSKRQFRSQLRKLVQEAGDGLLVPESPRLGCFGFARSGIVHTADTLKYFEVLSALKLAAALPTVDAKRRPVIWEIGGGWGGFAYQFKTLFPRVTYVLSAHPDQLLLSATYLRVLFPHAVVRAYGGVADSELWHNLNKVDFVFVPDNVVQSMRPKSLALAIDVMALEGMNTAAIENHVRSAFELGGLFFYSAMPTTTGGGPSALRTMLARYYWLHELPISQSPGRHPLPPWPPPTADEPPVTKRAHVIGWKRLAV